MAAAENLSDLPELDKLTEKQMADRLGTTVKALQARRGRGQIPIGIWNKIGSHIIYSVRRYDEWLESLWVYPPGWTSGEKRSGSVSVGTASGAPKRSRIPSRKPGSRLPPALEIK